MNESLPVRIKSLDVFLGGKTIMELRTEKSDIESLDALFSSNSGRGEIESTPPPTVDGHPLRLDRRSDDDFLIEGSTLWMSVDMGLEYSICPGCR